MAGYNPNEPRDEKGQWTAGSAATAVRLAASDETKIVNMKINEAIDDNKIAEDQGVIARRTAMMELDKELNSLGVPVDKKMDIVEDMIRYQKYESLAAYDANGNLAFFNDGVSGHVEIEKEQEGMIKDGYATHNHPHDQSFSNGDINTAIHLGLKEIRAASAGHDFVFRPNYKYRSLSNVGSAAYQQQEALDKAIDEEITETQDAIINGKMSYEDANKTFQHRCIVRFAEKTKGKYIVEEKNTAGVDPVLLEHSNYPYFSEDEIKYQKLVKGK